MHIEGGEFANKLIRHVQEDIKHLGNCKRRLLDTTSASKDEEGDK